MARAIFTLIFLFSFSNLVFAECNSNLYGKWLVTGKSYENSKDIKPLSFKLSWNYKKDGTVDIGMGDMIAATEKFECSGSKVTILKEYPSVMTIVKLTKNKFEYQEEGDFYIYYMTK